MTCFLACFPVSKFRKRRRLVDPTSHQLSRDEANPATKSKGNFKQEYLEKPINLVTVPKEVVEEAFTCHNNQKKLKFDLIVTSCGAGKSPNEEVNPKLMRRAGEKEGGETGETPKEVNFHVPVLLPSKPHNYRYANRAESDEDDGQKVAVEESSESLFSLSIDSRRRVSAAEFDDKEVNSPIPPCKFSVNETGSNDAGMDRSQFVDSVFSPDEQLGQLRAVEEKVITKLNHQEKENISAAGGLENNNRRPIGSPKSIKPTYGSKLSEKGKKLEDQEIAVDASLSSWLVESGKTPISKARAESVRNVPSNDAKPPAASHTYRPLLGELRMEKPTKRLASRTRTRRENQKPNEMPVVGTIGSYWRHTGQTLDSDSSCSSFGTPRTRSGNKENERAKWRELWTELATQI